MRAILFVFVFVTMAGTAHAQTVESRATITAIGGFGKTLDDEGSLGRGWLMGVAVEKPIIGNTRAEVSFEVMAHDRHSGSSIAGSRSARRCVSTGSSSTTIPTPRPCRRSASASAGGCKARASGSRRGKTR